MSYRRLFVRFLMFRNWPKAVIDDVEEFANPIAAFCREAQLLLLSLRIAASGQQQPQTQRSNSQDHLVLASF
jgi:hypothetical protein